MHASSEPEGAGGRVAPTGRSGLGRVLASLAGLVRIMWASRDLHGQEAGCLRRLGDQSCAATSLRSLLVSTETDSTKAEKTLKGKEHKAQENSNKKRNGN